MKVLISVPKNYGYLAAMAAYATSNGSKQVLPEEECKCSVEVTKIAESDNIAELVATKTKIEQDHARYIKEMDSLGRTQPIPFEQYEGTKEEYEDYLAKLQVEVEKYASEFRLNKPCWLNCDLFIL